MNICVINTGGTISSIGEPLAPMPATEFAEAAQRFLDPILRQRFPDIELVYESDLLFPESTSGTLDSTNLQPADWCVMAGFILDRYARFDGFVILHGTDSLDYSGSALPFLLNVFDVDGFGTAVLSKPVIVTGSQLPMFDDVGQDESAPLGLNFNTDAFQNLCGAIACARSGLPEVGVYFNGNLYRGSRAMKVNASGFAAFASPNYPALGTQGKELRLQPEQALPGPVDESVSLESPGALQAAKDQLEAIAACIDNNAAMQLGAFPAPYDAEKGTALAARLITACIDSGVRALILESYGEGNFPSGNPDDASAGAVYQVLEKANAAGVIIVDSTQVIQGSVNHGAYAAGAWLPRVGALSAADMTPMATLAKTIILRSAAEHHGWSLENVKQLIQLNLCGEMRNVSRLDSRANGGLLAGQSITSIDGSATLVNRARTGPELVSRTGAVLWRPQVESTEPGRLVLQDNGDLVLYDDANEMRWTIPQNSGGAAVLMITGSYEEETLRLAVYDYAARTTTSVLYAQDGGG